MEPARALWPRPTARPCWPRVRRLSAVDPSGGGARLDSHGVTPFLDACELARLTRRHAAQSGAHCTALHGILYPRSCTAQWTIGLLLLRQAKEQKGIEAAHERVGCLVLTDGSQQRRCQVAHGRIGMEKCGRNR